MGRAVCLNISAVDGSAFGDRTGPRKRLDQVSPEPFARPTVESIVNRRRRAIVGRTVAPLAVDLENMDNAGDHPTIINPPSTALVPRQQGLNGRPLLIQQSKQATHPNLQFVVWKNESDSLRKIQSDQRFLTLVRKHIRKKE
jgi:hypothetical protein